MSFKDFLARISPFGNPGPVQVALYVMVALFFGAMLFKCGVAKSAELEIAAGSTFVRGATGALEMDVVFPKVIANYANLTAGFTLVGQSDWCHSGIKTGPYCHNDNQAMLHLQAVAPLKFGFELGIGVAKLQHEDNYSSGGINFNLSLEHKLWARKFPNVYWRYTHFSNAGTHAPNEGRDLLLVGYRFK
jgi:hypothetical protein